MAPSTSLRRLPVALVALVVVLAAHHLPERAQALRFYLNDRERRCFKFEAPYHSRVLGRANVENGHGAASDVSVEVRDADNKVLYQSHAHDRSRHSSFSFETSARGMRPGSQADRDPHDDEPDEYDYDQRQSEGWFSACVVLESDSGSHDARTRRAVTFWVRADGMHNHDEQSMPRASNDKVQNVERDLLQTQQTLQEMAAQVVQLQQDARRMVAHSQATSSRLITYAMVSMIVMMATSAVQYAHLQTYFKGKKLL